MSIACAELPAVVRIQGEMTDPIATAATAASALPEAKAPRRPARARDAWARWITWRNALRAAGVAALGLIAVVAWQSVDHAIQAHRAYQQGLANARAAIASGHPILEGVGPAGFEVFVDPATGLPTSEPMMCCIISPFDDERAQGYADELKRALAAGELAEFDLRPKLRTEAQVLALFEEHADEVMALGTGGGALASADATPHVNWSAATEASPWSQVQFLPADDTANALATLTVRTPARALLVDDATTLLIIERTTAVQIYDLDHGARLAWYGGWMSANPRN